MTGGEVARGQGTASDPLPLILTKIRVPRRRRELLSRQRLVDFVHAHLDRKLLIISAPAGFGKTSLLIDFAHDTGLPVCWYTLDSFDRDIHVFLEHFVGSITRRFPAFGERSLAFLRGTADIGTNLYAMVASLVQDIYDTIPEYFFLVLDDYHAVEDQDQIAEFLDLFTNYVDENCHLILASRTLPALPNLSLLVARRQVAGLSIDELRFTPQEIQALVKQNYDLDVSLEQASQLAERTGGWITGLLLTSAHRWEKARGEVTLRGRVNVDLHDYLSRQVLDRQPEKLRDFLLASSVLDELEPGLCREALGIEHPAALMDQVRVRNLFIIEYEGDDEHLRYHDLFHEFLCDRLRVEDEPRYRDLMLRAAKAYAARGEWERAASRYLALEQYGPLVEIIERIGDKLFVGGRWDTLAAWIDALPEQEFTAHPDLLVQRGKIYLERGAYEQALALADRASALYGLQGDKRRQAYALVVKGHVYRFRGQYRQAIELSAEVLALVGDRPGEASLAAALAHKNAGLCWLRLGKSAQAEEELVRALRIHEDLDAPYEVAMLHHDLGLSRELVGDLGGAAEYYEAALQWWQQTERPGPWANTLNGLGVIYYLEGQYEKAQQTLEEALSKARQAGDLRVEAYVWASLGDLHRVLGAQAEAKKAFVQALEVGGRTGVGFILTYARNGLGNVYRLSGDLGEASRQLEWAMGLAREHGSDYEVGLCHTSFGILATESGELVTARQDLDRAVELFEAGGFRRDLAEALLHRAQAALRAGDWPGALADLERSLSLGGELGTYQFVIVEGERLADLLAFAREQGVSRGILSLLEDRIAAHRSRMTKEPEPVMRISHEPKLRILALGSPRVELDGESVQWTTVQSRDLFFCLVQHQGLRKEEIGQMFWPDHPPRRLDGIFRSTLYRLRRALYRDSVIFEDGLYRFDREGDYWLDVEAFEQLLDRAKQVAAPDEKLGLLKEALALYKADYLDGLYADWCALERERLRERHLSALEMLAGLYAGRGNLQRAIEQYQHLVTEDPYREPAHRELMRCQYRLGDRVAAIKQYQSCVEVLREDLGLSPMPETEALYLQIIG